MRNEFFIFPFFIQNSEVERIFIYYDSMVKLSFKIDKGFFLCLEWKPLMVTCELKEDILTVTRNKRIEGEGWYCSVSSTFETEWIRVKDLKLHVFKWRFIRIFELISINNSARNYDYLSSLIFLLERVKGGVGSWGIYGRDRWLKRRE